MAEVLLFKKDEEEKFKAELASVRDFAVFGWWVMC